MNFSAIYAAIGALVGGAATWGAMRASVKRLVDARVEERLAVLEANQAHMAEDIKALRDRVHEISNCLQDMRLQLGIALGQRKDSE